MSYSIEQIEDAIILALAPLKMGYDKQPGDPDVYATVRTIKSLQGELDSEEAIAAAVRQFPAILVVYAGSDYESHGGRKVEKMTYALFACDKSLRTEEDARRGGSGNPGVYALLNACRDILFGARLSLDIFPIDLLRETPVWFGKGVSIYSAEYETAQAHLYVGD